MYVTAEASAVFESWTEKGQTDENDEFKVLSTAEL